MTEMTEWGCILMATNLAGKDSESSLVQYSVRRRFFKDVEGRGSDQTVDEVDASGYLKDGHGR